MAKKVKKRHTTSKIVVADEGLRFVNRSGKVLAHLREYDDDKRIFSLFGVNGRPLATLGTIGTRVFLRVGSGDKQITLHIGDTGARIQVFDGGNEPQVYLGTTDDGGLIEVCDEKGMCAASMCVVDDGGLVSVAHQGTIVGGLGTSVHGGGLFISTPAGNSAASLYAKNGEGFIDAYDTEGNDKLGMATHDAVPEKLN